jgi:hypothetical protein
MERPQHIQGSSFGWPKPAFADCDFATAAKITACDLPWTPAPV